MSTRIPRSLGESDNSLSSALTLPVSSPPSPSSVSSNLPPIPGRGASNSNGANSGMGGPSASGNGNGNGGASFTTSFSHISSSEMLDAQMGQINPLAGLGLSVEQYPLMLQNLLGMTGDALDGMEFDTPMGEDGSGLDMSPVIDTTGSGLKRTREDEEERTAKRSRFEIVE